MFLPNVVFTLALLSQRARAAPTCSTKSSAALSETSTGGLSSLSVYIGKITMSTSESVTEESSTSAETTSSAADIAAIADVATPVQVVTTSSAASVLASASSALSLATSINSSAGSSASTAATSAAVTTSKVSTKVSASSTATSSSAATTSASTSSSKMGVSWPIQEVDAAPVAKFFTSSSEVSWWFNWNKNWDEGILTSDGVSISGEFVPMLFDTNFYANSDSLEDDLTELMGYNEPDLTSNTDTYITAAAAAAKWKTQIASIRSTYPSIKVHSPAMASNQDWLSTFFSTICPSGSASNSWADCDYAPDYVAVHAYDTDFDTFKSTVQGYYDTFGLPVVVSEFACYSFSSETDPTTDAVSTYMAKTTAWMDKQDWIVKYAWFGAVRDSTYLYGVSESNRLMDTSGALTTLGKQYIGGGQTS